MFLFDIAKTTGNHNWLVVPTNSLARRDLEGSEVASEIRSAKFVVKRRSTERSVGHDLLGRHNTVWFAVSGLPRTLVIGQI